MKCTACNHEEETKYWIKLEVFSSDRHTALMGSRYDEEDGGRFNLGCMELYACRRCGSIRIER